MTDPFRSDTHGPAATATVEEDFEGRAFMVTKRGAVVTGSITGADFTPDGTGSYPTYRVDRVQREVDVLSGALGIEDMQRESFPVPFHCVTDSGSTTTVIAIAEPTLPTIAATANHILHILDTSDGPKRPGYTVASTTGTTITLTGAMSEAAPAAGRRCVLVARRKLLPNATDFTSPAIGFQTGGVQYVAQESDGKIWRATAGSDLTVIASGSGTLAIPIGWQAGNGNITVNNTPRGRWDWASATIVGGSIPVAAISGAVAASAVGITGASLMASITPGDVVAYLGTGSPSGSNFLRGDGTWAAAGGGSTPTGTGFPHITAGVQDAASKLVENADVHASAGIVLSKLANGTACSVVGRGANSTGAHADIAAGSNGMVLAREGNAVNFYTINTAYTLHTEHYNRRSLYDNDATTPNLAATDPTVTSGTDLDQYIVGFPMLDASVTAVGFSFCVPLDALTGSSITPIICFVTNGAPGADTVDIDIIGTSYGDTDDAATGGSTFSEPNIIDISGYGAGDYVIAQLAGLSISVSAAGLQRIQGVVYRDATGGNTDDTYADSITLCWISFNGTRTYF